MIVESYTFSFLGYLVIFCAASGLFLLFIDAKNMSSSSNKKEYKVSKTFGWIHLLLGAAILMADWFM